VPQLCASLAHSLLNSEDALYTLRNTAPPQSGAAAHDTSFELTTLVIILMTAMRLTIVSPELLRLIIIAIGVLLTLSHAKDVSPPTFQVTFTQKSFDFQ
jgi:hypothetical protein